MLTIDHLSVEYNRRGEIIPAVQDVSLSLAPGETLPDHGDATLPPGPSDAAGPTDDSAPRATPAEGAPGDAVGPARDSGPKTGDGDAAAAGPDAEPGTENQSCPTCGGAAKDGSCENCGTQTGAAPVGPGAGPACYPTNRSAGPYHEAIQAQYTTTWPVGSVLYPVEPVRSCPITSTPKKATTIQNRGPRKMRFTSMIRARAPSLLARQARMWA